MNQVAVVIGGGQTLGEFLCRGLAAEGYRVAVVDIQSEKASRVAQEINAEYGEGTAYGFGADATSEASVTALDLAEYGITVHSLMLGNLLKSPMFQSLLPQYATKLGIDESEVEQYYIDKVPLKRGCDYQDVLNVLMFYASPQASYCTGQSINVTGGQVMF
ncbi:TPA: SDR family NAD(P)-dependent oxidoreductase [Klebsiella aerogenes]